MTPTYLPRAESLAILRTHGWTDAECLSMSDTLADWIATGLVDSRQMPPSWALKASHKSVIGEPDDPTTEEIAHAANMGFLPLKHRAAVAMARAEKCAALVAEGRRWSQNTAQSERTLMALANIAGTGRA